MNRAEHIFRLHSVLRGKTPVRVQRLADEIYVSQSSINRDIDYTRKFMGAPILYDRAENRYYYDASAPEFELPGLSFDASDLQGQRQRPAHLFSRPQHPLTTGVSLSLRRSTIYVRTGVAVACQAAS